MNKKNYKMAECGYCGKMRPIYKHTTKPMCFKCSNRPDPLYETLRYTEPIPQRNAPCPCGSGKKYKKCCLKQEKA